ncbi:demethylmenaquinone methyltransferase / 2-methoxy-6-polyprenyl-1,4-benzoquinol methylase [Methanosarcinales archaeon]|nr:demethylmenaquinone methyltransferase / 2-methoxy-6-polyprenyl-1,4-benzoquinol methylase [Methanosarcinales archaeon]
MLKFMEKLESTFSQNMDNVMRTMYIQEHLWKFKRGADIAARVNNELVSLKGKTVLDIGSGSGGITSGFPPYGAQVIHTDVDKAYMDLAEAAYHDLNLQIPRIYSMGENIPLKNNSVDIVIMYNILEHLNNISKTLFEVSRVLKHDGYVLLRVDYRFDWNNIKKDPHYGLPYVILLPKRLRKILLCNILKKGTVLQDNYWIKNRNELKQLFDSVGMQLHDFYDLDIIACRMSRS